MSVDWRVCAVHAVRPIGRFSTSHAPRGWHRLAGAVTCSEGLVLAKRWGLALGLRAPCRVLAVRLGHPDSAGQSPHFRVI